MTIKKIGKLASTLAVLEAAKGRRKLAEADEASAKAEFLSDAAGQETEWQSETGQKMASFTVSERKTLSEENLLALGVAPGIIALAMKVSKVWTLRIH